MYIADYSHWCGYWHNATLGAENIVALLAYFDYLLFMKIGAIANEIDVALQLIGKLITHLLRHIAVMHCDALRSSYRREMSYPTSHRSLSPG
jgi:hypothetical protein